MTKFGTVPQVMEKHISRESAVSPYHRLPNVPKFLGPSNNTQTVWTRATKFGMVHMGQENVLGSQPHPHPRGQQPQIFGTLTYAQTVWPSATKFGMVAHGAGACFLGSATPHIPRGRPKCPKNFGTTLPVPRWFDPERANLA